MDTQIILQMLQTLMPPESRTTINTLYEVAELQQLILNHAKKGGYLEMLRAIKPKLPEHNQHKIDILVKCIELAELLDAKNERSAHEHRRII